MSLDIGAIVGISVAAAAVAVIGGKLLFRKKRASHSNRVETYDEDKPERTKITTDYLNNKMTRNEYLERMSSAARGKGKKTKGRKSNRKKRSYKKK